MCSHIVRVKYKAQGEPALLLLFDEGQAALERIAELQKLETVSAIQLYAHVGTTQRTETWTERPKL